MYTICLDSSANALAVGIAKDDVLIDFTAYESWQSQSEHMIPELNALLDKHEIKREQIDSIIVSIGPGSYTGIRIALTIAKTMSLALNIPLYPVSSLRVLKDDDKPSICLINARSNRSYFGVFEGQKIIIEDCIKTNDEVKAYINDHPTYSICGDARYLGYENKDTNICLQMVDLKKNLQKIEDSLGLKPIYMKD